MADDIHKLATAVIELQRQHCKTLARLHAVEGIILESTSEDKRVELHTRINQLAAELHQKILEEYEKHSPEVAAVLDNRRQDELP